MYNIILKHFLASRLYEKCVMIGYGMGRDIKLWIDLAVSRGLYGWLRVCCLGSIESAHGTDSNEVWSLSFLMGIQIVRCTMNFRVGASSVPVSTDALMPDDFFFHFSKTAQRVKLWDNEHGSSEHCAFYFKLYILICFAIPPTTRTRTPSRATPTRCQPK